MKPTCIAQRITQLRMQKGISESQMSIDLDKSRGYIQSITSGKTNPSFQEFFKICEYFHITPSQFFDMDYKEPTLLDTLVQNAKTLSATDLTLLIDLAKRLNN